MLPSDHRRRAPAALAGLLLLLLLCPGTVAAGVQVRIDGLPEHLHENARLRLSLLAQRQRRDLDQAMVEALYREGFTDIRRALQPFGHYNPVMRGELTGQAPDWTARYTIDPGPQTRIAAVQIGIEGEGAEALQPLRRELLEALAAGEPLRHARYEAAKDRLSSEAYAAGYLDARFTSSELRIVADDNEAQIALVFDTGPQYRFGALAVEQDVIDDAVLRRYVPIRPGEVFDPKVLLDTQFALTDLGYFETLEIEPQREAAEDGRVPILIRATPQPRTLYNFGVGYGTDTGARVSAGAQLRRVNRAGHTARIESRVSEVKTSAVAEYRIPLGTRVGENLGLSAQRGSERFDSGDSRKWGVEVGLARIPGDWNRRLYLAFTHEESRLGTTQQTADLLTPGVTYTRTAIDDPIYARRGWSVYADAHGAVRGVLADVSFARIHTQLRGALPLGERARLLGRLEYGANFVEVFDKLPASQRFFAGGDQSVRGYDYQSLGPTDAEGNVIGGEYLGTFSLEAELPVRGNWGVALFYDAGGADNDPAPRLYQGVGSGLRYRAPIGSVQLDVAHPLDDPDGGVRVHLGVRVGL